MARRYDTVMKGNVWAWRTRKCEDYLIVDAILKIKWAEAGSKRLADVVNRFLYQGLALSDRDLTAVNDHLARIGEQPVEFLDSHSDGYAAETGYGKANIRKELLRSLESMTAEKRAKVIAKQQEEARRLPPEVAEPVRKTAAVPEMAVAGHNEDQPTVSDMAEEVTPHLDDPRGEAPTVDPHVSDLMAEVGFADDEPKATGAKDAAPAASAPASAPDGHQRYEITFTQTVRRVGTLRIKAPNLMAAIEAANGAASDRVDWTETSDSEAPRMTGAREV